MLRPARLFISYAHADEAHRKRLNVHLAPLKREGLIAPWHDRMIVPGAKWGNEIDRNLTEADIVLLLVSADFVASDYCFEKELRQALDRHGRGEARVIPVFVEPTDFNKMPFAKLQCLPRDVKPVSLWLNKDEAWLDVVKGIRRVVERMCQDNGVACDRRLRIGDEFLHARCRRAARRDHSWRPDGLLSVGRRDHYHINLCSGLRVSWPEVP